MRRKAKMLPVRILKVWFDVVLVVGGAAGILMLGWLALSPFVMARGDRPADGAVQVVVGQRSWLPVFPLDVETTDLERHPILQDARLVRARGELRFLTTRWWLHMSTSGGLVVGALIAFYVIWLLRKVLVNVLADRPFDAANGRYMSRCGYIILALGAAWPILEYAISNCVLSRIRVTNIDLRPAITLDKDVFVLGLLFLVFGAILTRGHDLQEHEEALEEEQALTI